MGGASLTCFRTGILRTLSNTYGGAFWRNSKQIVAVLRESLL